MTHLVHTRSVYIVSLGPHKDLLNSLLIQMRKAAFGGVKQHAYFTTVVNCRNETEPRSVLCQSPRSCHPASLGPWRQESLEPHLLLFLISQIISSQCNAQLCCLLQLMY